MPFISPFESLTRLPALAPFLQSGGARTRAALSGLIGAARPLAAASIGLGAKQDASRVVLYLVEGPEAALDAVADLRAFLACEEMTLAAQKIQPRKLSEEERYLKNLNE